MIALLVAAVVLLAAFDVGLLVVGWLLWRYACQQAHKRGLLDAVDMLRKRRQWYA